MTPRAAPARLLTGCLLGIIMTIAAFLRFSHADWDGGYQLHPDERAILFVAQEIHPPHTLSEALDARLSPINPYRNTDSSERLFAYGSLPLYLEVTAQRSLVYACRIVPCRLVRSDTFAGRVINSGGLSVFDQLTFVGRALAALFDTLTVLAVFLLTMELSGSRVTSLVASAMLAVAVLHIQNAHFGAVDSPLAFFCTLSLWLMVRWARTDRLADSILAGAAAGLATGCKASGILLLMPLLMAHLQLRHEVRNIHDAHLPGLRSPRAFWLTIAALMIAFIVTNPYALLDAGAFASSLGLQLALASGVNQPQFVLQYVGTLPVFYSMGQLARWGFGLPLALAACLGLGWGVWRTARQRSRQMLILVTWVILAGIMLSSGSAKFPRYLMPITPALIALTAGIVTIPPQLKPAWKTALAGAILLTTSANAAAFTNMYQTPHPWLAASKWIYANIPAGSTLVDEANDDALPLDLSARDGYHVRDLTYHAGLIDPLAEPDDCVKIAGISRTLAQADYVIIAGNRLYGVVPRLPERFPLTASYYEKLMSGELGFALRRSWYRYPNLFGWSIVDDPFDGLKPPETPGRDPLRVGLDIGPADESFSVYDHPLALLFQNRQRLSAQQIERSIMGQADCHSDRPTSANNAITPAR